QRYHCAWLANASGPAWQKRSRDHPVFLVFGWAHLRLAMYKYRGVAGRKNPAEGKRPAQNTHRPPCGPRGEFTVAKEYWLPLRSGSSFVLADPYRSAPRPVWCGPERSPPGSGESRSPPTERARPAKKRTSGSSELA